MRNEELKVLQETESEYHRYHRESQALFDAVVDAMPPTQVLVQLNLALQQAQTTLDHVSHALEVENLVESALNRCLQGFHEALKDYQQVSRYLREAETKNEQANRINTMQMHDSDNSGHGESYEYRLQRERDRLVNKAQHLGNQAMQEIQNQINRLPSSVHSQFPSLLPAFQGMFSFLGSMQGSDPGHFWIGGDMGDMMNAMEMKHRIHSNLQLVAQAESNLNGMMGAITQAISQMRPRLMELELQTKQATQEVESLEKQKKQERNRIFISMRQQIMGG